MNCCDSSTLKRYVAVYETVKGITRKCHFPCLLCFVVFVCYLVLFICYCLTNSSTIVNFVCCMLSRLFCKTRFLLLACFCLLVLFSMITYY